MEIKLLALVMKTLENP